MEGRGGRECFKFISMKRHDFKKTSQANEVLAILLKPNSLFIKQNAEKIDSVKSKMRIIVMNQQKTCKMRKCSSAICKNIIIAQKSSSLMQGLI